ncbi:membrane protein insertion efficiency factor YidD [Patescibacteria group bacterium]|nr:membrane protein insertion efficiency factor YidD [Patescibacteria group bacterium]MBU1895861.1 membrane protein insertion efficiency factor YidD [Patescibacteria group bacterium]
MWYVIKKIISLPRQLVLFFIYLYQKLFSPDHSFWSKKIYHNGYCKYYPSCSEYSRQIIKKRGILVGIPKSLWRVLRCNPWSNGGVDIPN